MTTRIRVRAEDGHVISTLLLDDRADVGPEIRDHHAADCDAGPAIPVDIDISDYGDNLGEKLGLNTDEIECIVEWRQAATMTAMQREQLGMTSSQMGKILDKIAKRLQSGRERDTYRIVIEVEPTP